MYAPVAVCFFTSCGPTNQPAASGSLQGSRIASVRWPAESEDTVDVYSRAMFDGGLANTCYGHVDPQRNVVLSADLIHQSIRAYLQLPEEQSLAQVFLCPFDGEETIAYTEFHETDPASGSVGDHYCALRIDRTDKVIRDANQRVDHDPLTPFTVMVS